MAGSRGHNRLHLTPGSQHVAPIFRGSLQRLLTLFWPREGFQQQWPVVPATQWLGHRVTRVLWPVNLSESPQQGNVETRTHGHASRGRRCLALALGHASQIPGPHLGLGGNCRPQSWAGSRPQRRSHTGEWQPESSPSWGKSESVSSWVRARGPRGTGASDAEHRREALASSLPGRAGSTAISIQPVTTPAGCS